MHPLVRNELSLRVYGLDHLQDVRGPVVFFSNHSSHLDATLILCTLPDRWQRRTAVGAARDYFFDVWWRQAFTALVYAGFPIDRAKGGKGIDKAKQLIREGWSIVVFPEGTRTPDGHMQRFRHGASRLALELGVGLVPIAIVGAYQAMPKGRWWPGAGRPVVTIRYGDPIYPEEGARRPRWRARPHPLGAARGKGPGRSRVAAGPRPGNSAVPRTGGEGRRTTIVEESIRQFGRDGYNGASLERIAQAVGVRKQTLLYYFPTKDDLLEACLAAAGQRAAEDIASALEGPATPGERAERVIHAVYSLAEEWPEFPMFIREAGRLGPTAFERFGAFLEPLRVSATEFLQTGMDAGLIRKQDPALLLFTLYTAVIGSLTEASVLSSFVGADDARSSLKRREAEVVELVRAALRPPEA